MKIAMMVPLVSFLAALRILTEAQICNNGEGKIAYEKLVTNRFTEPNSSAFTNDTVPYEIVLQNELPLKVLEQCFQTCQQDKLSKISTCAKFDFLPGKRIPDSEDNNVGVKGKSINQLRKNYEPSRCVFYSQSNGSIDLTEFQSDSGSVWRFSEVCLSAQNINRMCPNRAYVFERISGFKLTESNAKEVIVRDKNECENICLTERMFTCRSASFDRKNNKCYLNRANRHVSVDNFKPDLDFEYLENMCLKHTDMCKWNVFIVESGKQLESNLEKALIPADSVSNCSNKCLESLDKFGFVCRSFAFDEEDQSCILYDEDPLEEFQNVENATQRRTLVPSKGNLYRVLCSSDDKAKELDNQTLECYRHKRLRGRHQVERFSANFYDCLSNCLHQFGRHCRSIEFSHPLQICRYSGHSVIGPISDKDGDALIEDDSFDYYQFMWNDLSAEPEDKPFSTADHLSDRQDSIEVSANSHPTRVYGKFVVPSTSPLPFEQTRDHHRGGFAFISQNRVDDHTRNPPMHDISTYYRTKHQSSTPIPTYLQMQQERIDNNEPRSSSNSLPYQPSFKNVYMNNGSLGYVHGHTKGGSGQTDNFIHGKVGSIPGRTIYNVDRTVQYNERIDSGQTSLKNGYTSTQARTPQIGVISQGSLPARYAGYGLPPYLTQNQGSSSRITYPGGLPPSPLQMAQSVNVPGNAYGHSYGSASNIGTEVNGQNSISACKYDNANMDTTTKFKRVGFSSRLKSKHIYKVVRADRLEDCERFCLETKDFVCKSFNFRAFFPDNCELSSSDTKKFKLDNAEHFEYNTQFDYFERIERKALLTAPKSPIDCFEVLQSCSPEGMELKLRTTENFYGRIYTYGFYDSCFFDGNGAKESTLRISKPNGFPRCGTQQVGDAMTNIVVVQFNDYVQTSRDRKYNLTCFIAGPGEAVVTSNYMDTKTDGRHPMQIEHLPAQNILVSNIALRVLYRGTPTNTIVVGDLLTFRLESRNQYRFNGYHNDIFATNVIAKDPYSGRQVLLIDSRGCPVDLFVFPELHKTPDGALEAEFYAFKIPDSNFLIFQATVKTCKGPCEPVICTDSSRGQGSFPSWGRRKRAIRNRFNMNKINKTRLDEEEVHEMLRVYLSPEDLPESAKLEQEPSSSSLSSIDSTTKVSEKLCIDKFVYYTLVSLSTFSMLIFALVLPFWVAVKVTKMKIKGNHNRFGQWPVGWFTTERSQPFPAYPNKRELPDKASRDFANMQKRLSICEPVFCDPSILERSRSLQSLSVQNTNKVIA